ncbi:MAG: SDR family oxidoreductase [Xanthomonadales bacterium]|jgi:short-subunit dehydrogenase|nr:SDR family oxidoreductase [Xanthomonadales bacterium]
MNESSPTATPLEHDEEKVKEGVKERMRGSAAGERPWALVTGASAGIGLEFCRQLAARGYSLVLLARREERLREIAEELGESHGADCRVITADLSDPAACEFIQQALDEAGISVELLVNNAGYGVPGKLVDVPWETHQAFLQVMVTAVCELTWRLMPGMIARGRGHIINVASVAGLSPSTAGHTLYGASKAFLIKFSEALAQEGAPHGVRVSALCPGFTYSEFHDVTGTRDRVSQLPGYLWLQADEVVADGLDAVLRDKPRVVTVPGGVYKLLVWISGAFPGLGRWLANRNAHKFRDAD